MGAVAEREIEFPGKLNFLFEALRYKVAYGGRASAKSWSFARALLVIGASRTVRILCTREVQKSIKDSVHKLLSDQILAMGLGGFYEILETEIRGRNGTSILFAGLATHTVESLKSFESVDIVWVEEAQAVSKHSWSVLIPTIRKAGSEIWVTFNPELDTDDTWQRFVVNTPPRSKVVSMNYMDNPWFSAESEEERQTCLRTNPDDYDWIWLGKCKLAVSGAIYAKEVTQAQERGQIRDMPRDYSLPVFAIWDLGWNDCMSIILAQRVASEVRAIDYIEDSQRRIDEYLTEIDRRGYKIAAHFLPHDGEHKNIQTGKSAKESIEALRSEPVFITPNMSVEDGIRAARSLWPRIYIDKTKCARLIECLKRYRRQVNSKTGEAGAPLHDEYSHGADDFRYLAINEGSFDSALSAQPYAGYSGRRVVRG